MGVTAYFCKQEIDQFFAGAELCARWVQLGGRGSLPVGRIEDYAGVVQEALLFPYAFMALKALGERVWEKKFDLETGKELAIAISCVVTGVEFVVNKIFESKNLPLKPLGFAEDVLHDLIELKSAYEKPLKPMTYVACLTPVMSIGIHVISLVENNSLHRVSLVLETTVFVSKFALNILVK